MDDSLLTRFEKTVEILLPTLNYTSQLDVCEIDYCEQTMNELGFAFLFMFNKVVKGRYPDSYSETAVTEMHEKLKILAGVSAADYKRLRNNQYSLDQYEEGFYIFLETFLLMYKEYSTK